jgi:iron complex outermembrane recepter protein
LQIIGREEIERTGATSLGEILHALPSSFLFNYDEKWTNGFAPGGAGPGLRGLSQKYTLTLVNGRRVANYAFGQGVTDTFVDLNSLPLAAVDRIEVLRDGASAIYGSEAAGGVVNIILKTNYQGTEAGASIGTSYNSDLNEKKVHLVHGFGDMRTDRYNVLATFDAARRDLLTYDGRDYLATQDFRDRPGGVLLWNQNGGTYRTVPRQPFATCPANQVRALTEFNVTSIAGSVCAFNPAQYFTLFPGVERYHGSLGGRWELSPRLDGFAELLVGVNRNHDSFRPATLNSTALAFDPVTGGVDLISNVLPVGNPSNPFSTPVGVQYVFRDVGGNQFRTDAHFYRLLAGVEGTARQWQWQAAALHSESRATDTFSNMVNRYALARVIADGSYNFLDPSTTPAATDALRTSFQRNAVSRLDAIDAKASTDLMQLAHGPLSLAVGAEWRHESMFETPDPLLTNGTVYNRSIVDIEGARSAAAAFFEINVPAFKSFEANLAARYDRYSDFGSAVSPKGAFKWQLAPAFLLRGTLARGFRAPSLPEIGKSAASFFGVVQDRFDPVAPGQFVRVAGIQQNNPDLAAERTKNANLGVVWTPAAATNVGLAYYRVEVNNAVSATDFQRVADNPQLFPGQVIRNQAGELLAIISTSNNAGETHVSGYDLDFSHRMTAKNAGSFTLAGSWTYLADYSTRLGAGSPLTNFAGSNGFFAGTLPRLRAVTTLTWQREGWSAVLTHSYIHSFRQAFVDNTTNPGYQQYVSPYRQYDFYLERAVDKRLKVFGSIRNLFNAQPPFDPAGGGFGINLPYSLIAYDARGRYFTVGVSYRFR